MKHYPSVSKVYDLGEGNLIGVDQSNWNSDRTCLCFGRVKEDKIIIERKKYIEKQEDIDKYANKDMVFSYGYFGIGGLNDR